ncbi:MAG TPA: hypothetical protein VHY31_27370 [Streptosporangiaceae bacterium]|nr:hypothetical protein [Streptosporangiaceae bacterium]
MTVTATPSEFGDVTLWDTGNPKLYNVVATLLVNVTPLHDYQVRTGFREAAFRLDGFYLNGRRVAASDDRYCGLLAWAGFDYPSGRGHEYRGAKYVGVVDGFRVAKPGAAIYQAQVDPRVTPVIAPAFYWDFGPASPVTSLPAAMILGRAVTRVRVRPGANYGPGGSDPWVSPSGPTLGKTKKNT